MCHTHIYTIFVLLIMKFVTLCSAGIFNTNTMPSGYQLIRELTMEKDDNSIKVRLIRMWDAINRNTKLTICRNLILLDEEVNTQN